MVSAIPPSLREAVDAWGARLHAGAVLALASAVTKAARGHISVDPLTASPPSANLLVDRYQHFYSMGGLTRSRRTSIFSNI